MKTPGEARSGLVIALAAAMSGCSPMVSLHMLPVAQSVLCGDVPTADLTVDLGNIRDLYVRDSNSATAAVLLDAIANQFACAPNVALVVAFSYSGSDLPTATLNGTACIGASALERRADRPRFEHWVACDEGATLEYLIDFNNIETENEAINPSLRMTEALVAGPVLTLYFSQTLDARVLITDYADFLEDGVLHRIGEHDQFELAVSK